MTIPMRIADDKRSVVVTKDTAVTWMYSGVRYRVVIPEGYQARPGVALLTVIILGLTTYPLALWQAAVLHDYLYDQHERTLEEGVPRPVADPALLADEDDPRWLAWVAWTVVRGVGWVVW